MSGAGETAAGQQQPSDDSSEFNKHSFLIEQLIKLVSTATLVQVQAVTAGGLGPIGTVDVQPLVNLLDGAGASSQHGILHTLPYFRYQGGPNAVICDPVVGDIGMVMFADRDISSVVAAKGIANPGSRRRFDMADGLYVGLFLSSGAPTQYLQFTSTGMTLVDMNGNSITMGPSGIIFNGHVLIDRSGNVSGAGTVMASGEGTFNGHTVGHHTHTQPNDSHGDSEMPTNTPTG